MGTLVEGGVLQGEENKEGGNTGRGWGKGRRAERVGTLVEGGVLQGEENGKSGDTGRGWGVARGGERKGWGHW